MPVLKGPTNYATVFLKWRAAFGSACNVLPPLPAWLFTPMLAGIRLTAEIST
jgi:hypothetical protein